MRVGLFTQIIFILPPGNRFIQAKIYYIEIFPHFGSIHQDFIRNIDFKCRKGFFLKKELIS